MTERIFYTDVCCHTFRAAVLDCQPRKKKGYEVILDKTAFYPEGGGQPGDRGTLGGVHVTDTQERGGDIIHLTDAPWRWGPRSPAHWIGTGASPSCRITLGSTLSAVSFTAVPVAIMWDSIWEMTQLSLISTRN